MNNPDGLPLVDAKIWYYAQGDQRRGPISIVELKQLLDSNVIPASSLIWKQGFRDWVAASQVRELIRQSSPGGLPKSAPFQKLMPQSRVQPVDRPTAQDSFNGNALVSCYGCGQQIPVSALSCPNCGAPKQGAPSARSGMQSSMLPSTPTTEAAPIPPDVKGWSWGAFLLNWVWAIGNRTWIGLLALVPLAGIIMAIILGVKGRQWAWKNKSWKSVEHFNVVQRRWSIWGFVIVFLSLAVFFGVPIYFADDLNHVDRDVSGINPDDPQSSGATETAGEPSARNALRDAELVRQMEALRRECFGDVTNTCTNKNIDFDIAVLKANDTSQWLPFSEVRTREKMVEVFGKNSWDLFEQAVDTVRSKVIAHLESKRPSTFALMTGGDDPPTDGGVRAFGGPEDLVPIKTEMKNEFIRLLKESGWQPSPEVARLYGDNSSPAAATTQNAPPTSEAEEKSNAAAAEAAPNTSADPGPNPTVAKLPFIGTQEFNFSGGSGTGESITIAADGSTQIVGCGDESLGGKCVVEYSGTYQKLMQTNNGYGWLVQGDQIIEMRNGQVVKECGDDGQQICASSLTLADGK